MELSQVLEEVNSIFCKVLNKPTIILTESSTADDVDEWDSLNNIRLIAEVEQHFKVKFKLREIMKLKNVGELCTNIQKKTA
ncbi:acyl carrier protein [Ancylomarina euxinus]|uniref:Acyl carrier protein n=1 Tax=Ancylomarina euxinus TaxID=2283627 RepID=A0A425Y8K5_9BACT|nr:acyl carrier protein [Ancylomarina euxinus]MCZ4693460.1 acyl carrier protein [Ancylomarina euxinus]MUP13687.1 acyl carrier protein [Ancylomarina euxinus]RRG24672.1 acyl carrier protein [Ancylomarina euxinus]